VVVDRAGELTDADAAPLRTPDRPPLLVVTGRADAAARAALVERFALRDPVHAGGGWDPGSHLVVERVDTPSGRRRALERHVRAAGPAVVVTASRERADRVVTALVGAGLRAAAWAPPPMRASRAAAAVGAWRSRRLDALVLPAGELPPLGRGRVPLLVGDAVPGADAWRDLVEAVGAGTAVLLVGPDAPADLAGLAAGGCRRAALLEAYGEPVTVPCGACDACASGPAADRH
jgi:superfamily II DNA helicase RecQ